MKNKLAIAAITAAAVSLFLAVSQAQAATLVTNGNSRIGSFPSETYFLNTNWRIDTSVLDTASVTGIGSNFAGPSDATLADATGWTSLYSGSMDDSYVQVPFGFSNFFNTVSYNNVYVGSNTYLTFGSGASVYSGLSESVPPYPGVHMGSADNSYQKVLYKLDDASTMRVRYEGTASTGGSLGFPNIVYEALFYQDQPYFDMFVGIHARSLGGPSVSSARVTGGNQATIVYSEAMAGDITDYSELRINGTLKSITDYSGDGTNVHVLTFNGDAVGTDAVGTLDINNPPTSIHSVGSDMDLPLTDDLTLTDGQAPSVTVHGDGESDYVLPTTCPSVACNRGDIFGVDISFSEELNSDDRPAVESAITNGASVAPIRYIWRNNVLRIYATVTTTFANDVTVSSVTDLAGNTSYDLLLIDSHFVPLSEVWVDDDYNSGDAGGHTWSEDAFDNLEDAYDVIAASGIIHVSAGTYEDVYLGIAKSGVRIVGPGTSTPATILSDCDTAIEIEAPDVRLEGLVFWQTDGGDEEDDFCEDDREIVVWAPGAIIINNEIAGGDEGVYLSYQSPEADISGNYFHDNNIGASINGSTDSTISNNTFSNNATGVYITCDGEYCQGGGTVVSGNTISGNDSYGILFDAGDQGESVTIGPDNLITNNADGIYIDGDAHNVLINGNQIYDNYLPTSALHVEEATTGLDATENWWGNESGPYESTYNPDGSGDAISIVDSDFVYFRPYCIDEDCEHLSSIAVGPDDIGGLFDNGGSIAPVLDGFEDDADPETVLVTSLNVFEEVTIEIPSGGGTTTITLPAGTVITKSNGGTFDANDMAADDVDLGALSGFSAGTVVNGAVQWGIPNFGLEFSQPITVSIYVGTAFSGQTLNIQRSVSGSSGWTNAGVVSPATCLVSSGGMCEFQTTKASFFGATKTTSSGGGGSFTPPSAVGDGLTETTIAMNTVEDIGTITNGGVNVLAFIDSQGNFSAPESSNGWRVGSHSFRITNLDLSAYIITLVISSESKTVTLNKGESKDVDIDGDQINDVKLTFANTYVNRAEITFKSLAPSTADTVNPVVPAAEAVKFAFKKNLKYGMTNGDVKELQKFLNAHGMTVSKSGAGSVGKETTRFGPATRAAVVKFQKAKKIFPAVGYFGPITRAILNAM